MPIEPMHRLKLAARVLLTGKLTEKAIPAAALAISAQEVAEVKQFFPREKFFIYGHARSGTTLLARLVRVHPEVHCNWQAHFFSRPPLLESLTADPAVREWLGRRSNRWNQGGDLSALVLRAAADLILEREAAREGKSIVGDKSPNSLLDGEAVVKMQRIYPDARLVYIVRDGRDTAVSHRFQAFIDSPQHLNQEDLKIRAAFAADPEPFQRGERSIFTEKSIGVAAQSWVKNVAETDRAGRELYGKQYHALRYEDLLVNPWQEMCKIWSLLGALTQLPGLEEALLAEFGQNPDAEWQQKKAGELTQARQKGKQGSWRELFTARDRKIYHQLAGETLQQWGYEVLEA